MYTWIYFTLLAATMQAVRTAGQKQLGTKLNTMAASGVRYIFALPFGFLYLYFVSQYTQVELPKLNQQFIIYALIACAAQIIEGEVDQSEGMGVSEQLQKEGYALLCVSYPRSDLKIETEKEDEVYQRQFGKPA